MAAFPVLAVFSANVGLFPLADLWRPLALATLAGLALWLLLALARKSVEKGATVATCLFAAAWAARPVLGEGAKWWMIAAVALVGLGLGLWWSSRPNQPTRALNAFGLLLVLVAAGRIGWASRPSAPTEAGTVVRSVTERPDVFYLLLDGYGREDQIRRVMGFDNGPFIAELRKRGFFVADQARANYVQTVLSLASILNTETIQSLYVGADPASSDRVRFLAQIERPKLVRELRGLGYETIAIGTGFPSFTFSGFDLVYERPSPVTYFETTLLALSPIGEPERVVESQFDQRRRSLQTAFGTLRRLAHPTAKPRFVFAHVMAPHPPFVFEADGSPTPPNAPFGYFDGSDFMQIVGTEEEYRKGYVAQLQWLNRELLKAIDALAADRKTPPIIVLQADHGSKLGLNQVEMEDTDLEEAFGTLSAYRVPEDVRNALSQDLTPLAAIEAIRAKLLGLPVEPAKESRDSFFSPFTRPLDLTSVTERVR